MAAADCSEPLRFPVRRDAWDTVDFYLLLPAGGLAAGSWFLSAGAAMTRSSAASGWALLALGLFHVVWGLVWGVLHVWARFSQQYELTDREFIEHHGVYQWRVPYAGISGVHPVKICRFTTALKPAIRLNFRPLPRDGSPEAVIEFSFAGWTRRAPLRQRSSLDVSPVNLEGFLDELALRCPHLEREGPRFRLRPA